MGRFHIHTDGTRHAHPHVADHRHDPEVGDHSGYGDGQQRVEILEKILSANEATADENRSLFHSHGIRTINLMSSPGAGKTTLLRAVLARLGERVRVGIVEGDIETGLDADQLQGFGAAISLLNTSAGFGGECHLDATMVQSALERLPVDELDLLIIENVGNLVCPAEFDVGEDSKAMVYAITEGEEKPLKYPVMFRAADAIIVNKIDLLPHLDFDMDVFLENVAQISPGAVVLQASAKTGRGVDAVTDWMAARQ